jgi:hypothetical protein
VLTELLVAPFADRRQILERSGIQRIPRDVIFPRLRTHPCFELLDLTTEPLERLSLTLACFTHTENHPLLLRQSSPNPLDISPADFPSPVDSCQDEYPLCVPHSSNANAMPLDKPEPDSR